MFLALLLRVRGTLWLGCIRGHTLRRGSLLLVLLAHRPWLLELLLLELLLVSLAGRVLLGLPLGPRPLA
jgi:hypothetical protein